ncbi:20S proteasome subunit A/B [Haloplanus rallus]|jgi:proteasome beta subunit|uniref:20S proteasome subunit A/B n=1 Tax=Haloplanus rallus TaxID=1816183 RepID=A0A6B9F8G9_9EURY|nr:MULTISPECIES: 20S proteasome subunit A/B [Haloplanus]QGX95802.1 20S proteasome subunit A/B [Haloplanus rallus]
MSTVAGVACPAGVVLAGDRVVASGGRIRSRSRRHVLEFDRVGAAVVCGDVPAVADRLDAEIRSYRTERGRLRIDAVARLVADVATEFDASVLVTAPDDAGVPRLRSIDPDGGVTEESLAALGSGAALALGVLEAGHDPEASLDDAAALARDALAAAAERDPGTGTDVDTYRLPA